MVNRISGKEDLDTILWEFRDRGALAPQPAPVVIRVAAIPFVADDFSKFIANL